MQYAPAVLGSLVRAFARDAASPVASDEENPA